MPLRKCLQYLQAAWLSDGVSTDWNVLTEGEKHEAIALYDSLEHLTAIPGTWHLDDYEYLHLPSLILTEA